jgi:hypothetical protein
VKKMLSTKLFHDRIIEFFRNTWKWWIQFLTKTRTLLARVTYADVRHMQISFFFRCNFFPTQISI